MKKLTTERESSTDWVQEYQSLMNAVRIVQKARLEVRQEESFAYLATVSPAISFLSNVESMLMKKAEVAMRGAQTEEF